MWYVGTHIGRQLEGPLSDSMVNFWMEFEPRNALKPSNGILEVPVTNWSEGVWVDGGSVGRWREGGREGGKEGGRK